MFLVVAQILWFFSLIGMGTIVVLKIPELKKLPRLEKEKKDFFLKTLFLKLKDKIVNLNWELWVQKILSRIRVWALKIETKTTKLLLKLRERAKKKKENEDFWKKIS